MNHTLLQKYQIYSSKKLLPVVDFGRSWTTVFLAKLCLFFRKLLSYSKVFQQQRQRRPCANKLRLELERFLSARGSELRSVLMWTSVWSGNLLSSEVISLTHCIVKWWGGPSSKNGVTWPRFVRAASAFCLVSSQKWSVLFSMFDISPLHHVLNWQVFYIDICFFITNVYIIL